MTRRFILASLALALLAQSAAAQPAPVGEAVRACPQHGPGFYQVPGSATCMRIGGRVATEFTAKASPASRRAERTPPTGFGASARLSADTRTDTAYGPLRSYVRLKVRSGPDLPR